MSNQNVTVKDVIEATVKELESVSIPVGQLDKMAPPLSRALANLKMILQVFENVPEPVEETAEGGNEDAEEDQLEGSVQE